MVLYHSLYDMVYMFGVDFGWFRGLCGRIWELFICCTFVIISGVSCHLGSHNLRRGLIVFGVGCGVSLFTYIFMPSQLIRFGILSLLGLSMLLMIPASRLCKKINPIFGLILSFLLFLFTYGVCRGFLGIGGYRFLNLPDFLYSTLFLAFLGLPGKGFFSTDYFPLLPWFFLYCTGYFLWGIIKKYKSEKFFLCKIPFLQLIGRYSLQIYVIHQPVIYGVLFLVFNIGRFL